MESIGSISRQAKAPISFPCLTPDDTVLVTEIGQGDIMAPDTNEDPEVKIETWFNETHLEKFAASFEQVPLLWHSQHINSDGITPRSAEYLRLLDSLGEPCAGEPRARIACAKALCRVFCRLLRQKLRWAATTSLMDGTGEERALGMLPHWARHAERYMRYLPLIYLNTEQELKTKAEKAARAQKNKEKRTQEQKPRTPEPPNVTALYSREGLIKKKNTDKQQRRTKNTSSSSQKDSSDNGNNKQQPRTKNPSTSSQESSSDNANNKGSRPLPALVPIAPPQSKPSQYMAGRQLMQRVVCGMRRAAKIHGLKRKAAAVVAAEIGNQTPQVHALWSGMRVLAKEKLNALIARGDGRAQTETAHLSCLDWAVADLLMMYEFSPVQESSFDEFNQQVALMATFHLVQRFELETLEQDLPPHKWHEAARWYCRTGVVMSPVGLQRRWHDMKAAARARLAGDAAARPRPLHRQIAKKYPHVVTGRLRAWSELLAAGLVARPTNERGSLKRQRTAANDESTEEDDLAVIHDEESNTLVGDKAEASGEKSRVPSVRPGPSKSVTIIDNAPPQHTTSSEVSSEDNSNHAHTNVVENRHNENTRGGEDSNKNIDVNKELIDLDAPGAESEELKKSQRLDDKNAFNIETEVDKKEDYKNKIDDDKEIINLEALSAESEELKKSQRLDNKNDFNIETEVVKKEDYKSNIDDDKEIINFDTPSAESEELKKSQRLNDNNAFNIETKVVKKEDCKNKIDDDKEIINLDTPSAESEELKKSQRLDDKNAFNIDTEVVKKENYKKSIDFNKEIIDLDAPSAESDELKRRQVLDAGNVSNIVTEVVEGRIASKASNAPNSDDFATQVIRAIEKDIFYNGFSKFSKNNECNITQNCANVSNSKIQPSSKEKNDDGIENVTSASQINTNESNSSVTDATHKYPMLTQMLQTVCIFDDDAELTAFLNKNKEVNRKGNSSNTDVHEKEIKSLVENKIKKRVRAKLTDDWAQDIVRAIKRQRLESAILENPQICNLIEKEPSRGNVDISNKKYKSRRCVSTMLRKTKSNDTKDSKSVTKLNSGDEFYVFNLSSDDEDTPQDSEVTEDSIDPKLLMYPVIVMTRIENDPSLRIVPKLPPLPTSQSPSPNLSNLNMESQSFPDIKLEQLDDRDAGAEDTSLFINAPTPEILNEKTRALLKLCKPCVVLLERLEEIDKGIGRLAKRVELQDIDDVRRKNRRVLTAQVAPLAQDSESPSSDSHDSDWIPEMDNAQKSITNESSDSTPDSTSDSDSETDDNDNDDNDDETIKPAKANDFKNPDDHLKQLLNDFVDGAADAECCRRNKRTQMRGELATTASLAMERNCARCLWQLLSLPPASASEAHLQRRLLRHTVLQATLQLDAAASAADATTSTASTITEIPKQTPSGTKQIPKLIACRRNKKKSLPASAASQPDINTPPTEQNQRNPSAVNSQPTRIKAGKKIKLDLREPAGPSPGPKKPVRRVSAPIFRPEAVANINEKMGKLVKNQPPLPTAPKNPVRRVSTTIFRPEAVANINEKMGRLVENQPPPPNVRKNPVRRVRRPIFRSEAVANISEKMGKLVINHPPLAPAPGGFDPVITSVRSLAPPQPNKNKKYPSVIKLLQSNLAATARSVVENPSATNDVSQADSVATSLNIPKPSLNYVAIPSNSAQPDFNTLQPCNAAQSQNSQSVQFEEDPTQCLNMSNALQPQMNYPTPQYLPGTTHLPPVQTVVGQMESQNFALQGSGNVMFDPNTLAGNVMQPQGFQNAPWNNQRICLVKQETSAFQPVMPINANQPNPMYIQPNQPNPIYIQPNQPNPMYIQPNQPIPMYIQPNQPNPMYPNTMYVNPNQPDPMNIQPNQPNLIRLNPMYINPNQSNAMHINPNQPNPIFSNQMHVNPNQPNSMHINPNQPNPIYPTPMHINPNQSNPMYVDQNQLNLMNSAQINQPILCPSPMPIKTEQGSSYLPPMSHPSPYGTDSGYSPSVPILGNSTLTGISLPNTFNPTNAGSLQTLFNSMQEPSQSQSYQRLPSYDEAAAVLAGSRQESIQVALANKQGPSQFDTSKPSTLAVDVKIGHCDTGNELYNKLDSHALLKWSVGRAMPSHSWAAGRDPAALAVLCARAGREPWALLGRFLVLSEEEPPPPKFDVWALNPSVRLLLPHEKDDSTATDNSVVMPSRLTVKSFAKMAPPEVEDSQEWKKATPRSHAYAKLKLSDDPLVYAKLLVAVPSANACRQLLKRGGAVQLYCLQTYQLHPILSKPTGSDCQFSLSGAAAALPALRALARQLQDGGRHQHTSSN